MGQNLVPKSKQFGTTLGMYGLWVLLAVLWGVVAFQLQATLLYLGILVVQSPEIRPTGWNTGTISGINRCTFLILGALWLGTVIFTEKYLREGRAEHKLLARTGHLLLIMGGLYGFSVGLLYLLS